MAGDRIESRAFDEDCEWPIVNQFLWQNGREVDRFDLPIPTDPIASGLWFGDGLFETMLVIQGEIFARDRHMARFHSGLERLKLIAPSFDEGLHRARDWLGGETGRIRLIFTSDGEQFIIAREHQIPVNAIKLLRFPFPIDSDSPLSGIKTLSYGFNTLALRFARSQGADDAILINHRNEVTESSLANLVAWDGEVWLTPPLNCGGLPGVTRELLIEFFGVVERVLSVDDLREMKALALTSSLRDLQVISEFEGLTYPPEMEVDRLRERFTNWRAQNLNP